MRDGFPYPDELTMVLGYKNLQNWVVLDKGSFVGIHIPAAWWANMERYPAVIAVLAVEPSPVTMSADLRWLCKGCLKFVLRYIVW